MLLAEKLLAPDEELLGTTESVFFRDASPGRLFVPAPPWMVLYLYTYWQH